MGDRSDKILLTPHEIEQCEKLAGLGMSIREMGHIIGVSKSTMERRQHDQPELSEAIERGRAKASAAVRNTAFKMATSGRHAAMTIFWLKCRDQWREASEPVDANQPVKLAYVPRSDRGDTKKYA